ncbi:MAG: hypothetical protein DVB31_14775 [Verrucomicrobia bacterium]|nr:MAG: hypothetical protein DVB31_14775 [Verrucomicrobiota bacterium]
MKNPFPTILCAAVLASGCAAPHGSTQQNTEAGPEGTVAYYVPVESSEPGTKIEANFEMIGSAPLKLRIWGDTDGTFHNFGSYDYTVRAYPSRPGLSPQMKHFRCGGMFQPEDRIPEKIFFEFGNTQK